MPSFTSTSLEVTKLENIYTDGKKELESVLLAHSAYKKYTSFQMPIPSLSGYLISPHMI